MPTLTACLALFALASLASAQEPVLRLVDDFETDDIASWESSMSPEYYRGGEGRRGLEIVADPERGQVLRCNIRYSGLRPSEVAFITRRIDPRPAKLDVIGVRFWAKLTHDAVDPAGGFRVRLRTSDTEFTDYDVQEQIGEPFPADRWVRVELDTSIGPNVRNIWGQVFGSIREITFRMQERPQAQDTEFALLLDDIELVLRQPEDRVYEPQVHERPRNPAPRILLLKHSAAGYYDIEQAIAHAAPTADVDTFLFRGLQFEFFGFPATLEGVLAYDAVIMLDVDPFMMSWDQCVWVADTVASGAHLVLLGGPNSLTRSQEFKAPLQAVLPVTFEPGAGDISVSALPVPGEEHFLNLGFDPAGLGVVGAVHDLAPREGAQVPWTVRDRPLVVTAPAQRGRATVVNAWAQARQTAAGGFFTSALSDDFLRRLLQFALDADAPAPIRELVLPDLEVVGARQVRLVARGDGDARLRTLLDNEEVPARPLDDGRMEFTLSLPASVASETRHAVQLEALSEGQVVDRREFVIEAQNPLHLRALWERNKFTFAPGGPVEVTAPLSLRGLPVVEPGARTLVSYAAGRLPVSVDSFVDAWVYEQGGDTVVHNLEPAVDVDVQEHGGLPGTWTVTGVARCARPAGQPQFAEDDRIFDVRRAIQAHEDGSVTVVTDYEFLQDMRVSKLPLTVSLPVGTWAGLAYRAEQAEGVREGEFPTESRRGTLFDGHGLHMTIETSHGPLSIAVPDESIRVWFRDLRQHDINSFRLEIEAPYENREARKGEQYRLEVAISGPAPGASRVADLQAADLQFSAALRDPVTDYRWDIPRVEGEGPARFAGRLPNLASGPYNLEVAARRGEQVVVSTTAPCFVVDPLELADLYPIMSIVGIEGGGHLLDEAAVSGRVEDLLAHGFNTAAITGTSNFRSNDPPNSARLKAWAESFAQQHGMATTFEYSSFQLLGRNEKTEPCVFSPEYRDALVSRLDWQVDVGNRTPRLMTAKVIDEPTVSPGSMDYCEHCRAAFRDRYGIELRPPEEYGQDPFARWAYYDFLGEYVSEAYRNTASVVDELGASFDLLLTYMATGLGYQRPLRYQQDALDWTRHVQWADFDVYPYFYPRSQRIRMIQAGFAMTYMRDISRARGVPWGFYAELDDRNWPFQQNPRQATAECAFTAVAHGADYINSFINFPWRTGSGARPERWEDTGRALRPIRRIGPLLNRMAAVRAPLALLFPNAQQAIADGYPTPDYLLAAVKGGFGECDIYNEEVLVESGEMPYEALILVGAEFLHEHAVPLLKAWLEGGGTLICDALPTTTHRGAHIDWGFAPADTAPAGPLAAVTTPVGNGRLVTLGVDVNERFRELTEAPTPDPEACRTLRLQVADLLDGLGLTPNVRVDYRETPGSVDLIAAGLRANSDGALLIVVNHQPEPQEVTVTLARPDLRWLVDAEAMQEVPFEAAGEDALRLRLTVPGRWGRMIAGYRTRPERVSVGMRTQGVARGEELSYDVSTLDAAGGPIAGGVLLEVEVRDPQGEVVTRYGGVFAPREGMQVVRRPVAINAMPGRYTVRVTAPQTGARAEAAFTVN